jgi:hypothetical protein
VKVTVRHQTPLAFLLVLNLTLILGLGIYSLARAVHEYLIGTESASATDSSDSIEFADDENTITLVPGTFFVPM